MEPATQPRLAEVGRPACDSCNGGAPFDTTVIKSVGRHTRFDLRQQLPVIAGRIEKVQACLTADNETAASDGGQKAGFRRCRKCLSGACGHLKSVNLFFFDINEPERLFVGGPDRPFP